MPLSRNETVEPESLQTSFLPPIESLTGSPELALAAAVYAPPTSAEAGAFDVNSTACETSAGAGTAVGGAGATAGAGGRGVAGAAAAGAAAGGSGRRGSRLGADDRRVRFDRLGRSGRRRELGGDDLAE